MEEYVYLNLEDMLGYYCETIEQSGGGMLGVREREGIEKILDFVQNDVYYPTLEDKLTYMVFAFCTGHYFADGNKRISLVVGAHFLVKNKRAWAGFNFLPYMEAYIWHVAAGNIDKELLAKIIHSVINQEEIDEGTKLDIIHAMEKSPLFSEERENQRDRNFYTRQIMR